MSTPPDVTSVVDPQALGFEVRAGMRRIRCTVSDDALEAVSGMALPSTPLLRRRSFDRFRTLINAAAQLKLKSLPDSFKGPLELTRQDLRRVPPEVGVPSFGSSARLTPRQVETPRAETPSLSVVTPV